MGNSKSLTYSYLKTGLMLPAKTGEQVSFPVRIAFLFLLNDYLKGNISLRSFDSVLNELYSLSYFTNNMYSEDPKLWMVWEFASALSHPETLYDKGLSNEKKIDKATSKLKDFLGKNKLLCSELRSVS